MMAQSDKESVIQPAWMSPGDAAAYLGIAPSSFYRSIMNQDKVDIRKLGARTMVSRESLDAYMSSLPKQPRPGLRLKRGPGPGRPKASA